MKKVFPLTHVQQTNFFHKIMSHYAWSNLSKTIWIFAQNSGLYGDNTSALCSVWKYPELYMFTGKGGDDKMMQLV